jgi:hypothetical protein
MMKVNTSICEAVVAAVARPTMRQREHLREIIRTRAVGDGELVLLYARHRRTEASWLCAYARAAGMEVRLVSAGGSAHTALRSLTEESTRGASLIVLADHALDLPPGALHLPGTPHVSPIDLWQGAPLDTPAPFSGNSFFADDRIEVNRLVTFGARLQDHPVTLTVHDAHVTAADCDDPVLQAFLRRAVHVHHADTVESIDSVQIRLRVDRGKAYSASSADLRIELTASTPRGR